MVAAALTSYIDECLKKNMNEMSIRSALLTSGWTQVQIDEAFNQMHSSVTVAQNTSGMGDQAVVPEEIKGWSWGGFLLTWIWAVGNNVWIGLLALIPFLSFIMSIILGIKGREWAWQKKHWESVEQFKSVQRKWTVWGLVLAIMGIVLMVVYILFGVMLAVNSARKMTKPVDNGVKLQNSGFQY